MRPRRERGKVARMLWRRRMMQKFGWESFHNSIHIVHAKLALIDEEPISWRCAFEERHGSFDSPNSPNKRSDQQRDDTEMRDEKRHMMFAPGPTRKRGTCKVCSKQNKPDIEPRSTVNISARHFRIETRLIERPRDCGNDQHRQQDNGQLKRCEKFEERVSLPSGLLG